jgi:hypothetical protein
MHHLVPIWCPNLNFVDCVALDLASTSDSLYLHSWVLCLVSCFHLKTQAGDALVHCRKKNDGKLFRSINVVVVLNRLWTLPFAVWILKFRLICNVEVSKQQEHRCWVYRMPVTVYMREEAAGV